MKRPTLSEKALTRVKFVWILLVISVLLEILFFNRDTWFSLGKEENTLSYTLSHELEWDEEQGGFLLDQSKTATVTLSGMKGELGYLHLGIDGMDEEGKACPVRVTVWLKDEGNSQFYSLPSVTLHGNVPDTHYVRAHSYGEVREMYLAVSTTKTARLWFRGISNNAGVPLDISFLRIGIVFLIALLVWTVRPSSSLYQKEWQRWQKRLMVALILLVNIACFEALIGCNPSFMEPEWNHHHQYHKLAVSMSEGNLHIPLGMEEEISMLANPYDGSQRWTIPNSFDVWDTAFYNGHFYVYFGVVPVLLFYLPWYTLFGTEFSTWMGILIMGSLLLVGAFYLMRQIVKRYFPQTPFLLYVLLSLLLGNGTGTVMFMLRPDFYSLPILCALAFSLWGLGLWLSAARRWTKQLKTTFDTGERPREKSGVWWRLMLGSLCMALVAGCRAQFLMGSFLVFFIFAKPVKLAFAHNKKQLCGYTAVALLPYIVVAAGLMWYNAARFGSPFDFGANYNLTTNDMTLRGFQLGRVVDGVYHYLFQFPNIGTRFPFVYPTAFESNYIGVTIRENMYGGAFFVNILLWGLLFLRRVKDRLKKKGLFWPVIAMVGFGTVVLMADTQMAGILSRYYTDFLWLFLLAAIIVVLQLWEELTTLKSKRTLLLFVVISLLWGLFMQLGMGVQNGELYSYSPRIFYGLSSFFS